MDKVTAKAGMVFLVVALLLGLVPTAGVAASVRWEKVDPALQALMARAPQGTWPVIVEAVAVQAQGEANGGPRNNVERAERAAAQARISKAKPRFTLSLIGAAAATASYSAVAALSRDPFISYIYHDAPMRPTAHPAQAPASEGNVYEQGVRATEVWALGYEGSGVGIAILDSGVASGPDLTLPTNRVVARVNLVSDGTELPDPGGHGTHVAGIAAGNGYGAAPDAVNAFRGVAPKANIIDVRVIDSTGNTNISTVVRGVQWVVQNRKAHNIRAMNLSLGAVVPDGYSYRNDPLVAALDIAWLSGITVVVAAGNTGSASGTINSPGTGPMFIAVGATDDAGTVAGDDDTVATYSSRGPTSDGFSKPDLAAPGRRIVSLRTPSSFLDNLLPDRIVTTSVGTTYFRLSGTSMAAPVVAGAVALLVQKNPNLQPDQVKHILTRSARALSGFDRNATGEGVLDAYAAVTSSLTNKANERKRPADSFARTILPLIKGQPLTWRDLSYAGRSWANVTWDNVMWDNVTWDNLMWENILWDNVMWDNVMWDNVMWDVTWSSVQQDSLPWLGSYLD